jgi:hypothetical protein
MSIPAGRKEDDGQAYSIHKEVDHIVSGLAWDEQQQHAEPEAKSSYLKMVLRRYLAENLGYRWINCAIEEHVMPGGQRAFTVARRCKLCRTIHVYILLLDGSTFTFAAPVEE